MEVSRILPPSGLFMSNHDPKANVHGTTIPIPFAHSKTKTLIKPTNKRHLPPINPIRLHALDLIMPAIIVNLPLVFKIKPPAPGSAGIENGLQGQTVEGAQNVLNAISGKDNHSQSFGERFYSIVDKLKASLAEALEFYPPVAGTLHNSPDGQIIVCNGQGATLMTEVQDRPYVEAEHILDDLSGTGVFPKSDSQPPFAAKLTLFSCGTVVMVTGLHHWVADLTSYMDFLHTWALLSRGEDLVVPGTWSRNLNAAVSSSTAPSSVPGLMVLPPSSGPPPMPALRFGDGLRWSISEENLSKLKLDCMAVFNHDGLSDKWISSADAFTALVWGAMTRARHEISTKISLFTSNDAELESLGVAVDGRGYIGLGPSAPAISSGSWGPSPFFGNLNLSLAVYHCRTDLLEPTLRATSRVALGIRKTIVDETSPKAIAARIVFLDAQAEATRPHVHTRLVLEGDCRSTNWSKYDLANIDFGLGEDFERVGTGIGIKSIFPGGMFLIVKSGGRMVVATTVEKEADELLRKDPLLTKYCELLA
ncbi:hypothetical protein D9757_000415 [Collybiopsis confluens]|uniref:Transferase n=1 Tax=Collybiopsis confluens TaxID=2823264 RepID=A0A8H5MHT2_9AGAR|nr:hypothetical protein D9757_000415 [Collybiopsis confluens]